MGKWDGEREALQYARDVALLAQRRAVQKHDIIVAQQGDLWNELTQEFVCMVSEVNIGANIPLLRFSNLLRSSDFTIKATRPERTPTATVRFNPKHHQVTISFTDCGDAVLPNKYPIRANDDSRAEFVGPNHETVGRVEIVSETLALLY